MPTRKSVTGMGRVAKRLSMSIINGYLIIHYFMNMNIDLMIPVPTCIISDNKLSKLLKYLCLYVYIRA